MTSDGGPPPGLGSGRSSPRTCAGLSRRGLFAGSSAAALALVAGGCEGDTGERVKRNARSDAQLAAQLLELEYISVDFFGALSASAVLEREVRDSAARVLAHERAHVQRLEAIVRRLAGPPRGRPVIGLEVRDADHAIDVAAQAENLIASAYLGAVGRLRDPGLREAVLEIQAVEGAHAATFDHFAGRRPRDAGAPEAAPPTLRTGAFVTPLAMDFVERRLRALAVI